LLSALDRQRMRALLILDYHNRFCDDDQSPCTATSRQAFARWAAAAVKHFQGRGGGVENVQ
jgi:nicotinamidase-related amidase